MHIGGRPYSPPDLRRLVAVGSTQFYHRREVLFCWSKNLFLRSQKNMERRRENFCLVWRGAVLEGAGVRRGDEWLCGGRAEGCGFSWVLFLV